MNELNMSYKDALAEIEGIVDKIENEELDVDDLSVMVKRANELLLWCKRKLKATEEELNNQWKDLNAGHTKEISNPQ